MALEEVLALWIQLGGEIEEAGGVAEYDILKHGRFDVMDAFV